MVLQVPFVRRILDQYPHVEYHVWNLTRNAEDDAFVRGLSGDRIVVRNELHGSSNQKTFMQVFQSYDKPEFEGCRFVKMDDDIVFIQTQRFGVFLDAIQAHPGAVVSAQIINNGACTVLEPDLFTGFERLGIPLLDVHKSNVFGEMSHSYFFENYLTLLGRPVGLVPSEDWLSINFMGFDWSVAREIAARLGELPHPSFIAGRRFPLIWGLADEGMVNLLPRILVKGFVVCHLTFGPQGCGEEQCERWRRRYGVIGAKYLKAARRPIRLELPELSEPVCAQGWTEERDRELARVGANDPCVGRFTG
jgi:hypothetical protein